jgi:hypothetical protein
MDILRGFKLFQVILVILVCLFSLSILPSTGYGDEWVRVLWDEEYTWYYNSSSFKIDKQEKTIKVWTKRVFTDKGKIIFLNDYDSSYKNKLKKFNYQLGLEIFDYNNWKYCLTRLIYYTKSGDVLLSEEIPPKWIDIPPDSRGDFLHNRILKDFKIQR